MQKLSTTADFLARDSAALADSILEPCPQCGKNHRVPFGSIQSGAGLVNDIPHHAEVILGHAPRRAVLLFDTAIQEMVQEQVIEPLRAAGLQLHPYPLRAEPGHLLDSALENSTQAAEEIGAQADLLIGAGSGVICDMTKFVATRLNCPFILCGTAPSMNGYTSITATITENGVKISHYLRPADAVLLDTDILKDAPMPMIQAGIGDLAARAICNADWMLGHQLRGTYFCPLPHQMTAENETRYLNAAAGIARREPDAIEQLSEAILLSGLSMTILDGETSPSSGAEHVLSHFWDLLVHLRGAEKNFHGTQVGVATLIMMHAYQYLRSFDIGRVNPQQVVRQRPSLEDIEAENARLYGDKAPSFNEVARKKFIPNHDLPEYNRAIQNRWESLLAAVEPYAAPPERITAAYQQAGVPSTLDSIHRSVDQAREALLHGSHYRPRYTILDLLWELGLFPDAADEILQRAGML